MGAVEGGPNVVYNGLVLYLDAANNKSYVSGSTSWLDLTPNQSNSGSLTNGPTFNTGSGGNIVFDGTNDYIDFYASSLGTTTTVELWAKLGAGYSGTMVFGFWIYDVWTYNSTLGFNTGNGDVYGISSATVSSLGLVNNWKHYVFEMRSDVSYTNNKIYINSVSQTLSQQIGSEAAGNRHFNSGNGRLPGWRYTTGYLMNISVASFKIYNRALTSTEILQNYNATKTRFGL